jgi:glycosyltransferase involved in cell wall biosynthesis
MEPNNTMIESRRDDSVTPPTVSVIMACLNEEDFIEACLRSILAQKRPPGGFEVIVADGMSDDGTRGMLKRLTEQHSPKLIRMIDNPGRIVSTGLNTAIKTAKGKIIVRMDAHTEYASDYIQQCVSILQETKADNVGGPWLAKGTGFISSAIAAAFQSPFAVGGARGHDAGYEGIVDTVYLGCWPRQVFDQIGFFDEELVRNQDDEFNLRLTRAGGKIWQSPRIRSWYRPRGSLNTLFRQYVQYGYWKVPLIQKHKIPASPRHLVPACFVLSLFTLPLMALWWPPALSVWLVLLSTYSASNLVASVITAAGKQHVFLPLLPVVFTCYHIAYGYGFLRGICDFIIFRCKPSLGRTRLTRISKRLIGPDPGETGGRNVRPVR